MLGQFIVETKKRLNESRQLGIEEVAKFKAIKSIEDFVQFMQTDVAESAMSQATKWSRYAKAMEKSVEEFLNIAIKSIGILNQASEADKCLMSQKLIKCIQEVSAAIIQAYKRNRNLDNVKKIELPGFPVCADPNSEKLALENFMAHLNDVQKMLNISLETKNEKVIVEHKSVPQTMLPCETELKIATDTAIVSINTHPIIECKENIKAVMQAAHNTITFLKTASPEDKKRVSTSLMSSIQALSTSLINANKLKENLNWHGKATIQAAIGILNNIQDALFHVAKCEFPGSLLRKTFTSTYGTFFDTDTSENPQVQNEKTNSPLSRKER